MHVHTLMPDMEMQAVMAAAHTHVQQHAVGRFDTLKRQTVDAICELYRMGMLTGKYAGAKLCG